MTPEEKARFDKANDPEYIIQEWRRTFNAKQ